VQVAIENVYMNVIVCQSNLIFLSSVLNIGIMSAPTVLIAQTTANFNGFELSRDGNFLAV